MSATTPFYLLSVTALLSTSLACSVTLFGADCDKNPPGPVVTSDTQGTGLTTWDTTDTGPTTITDDCPDDGEVAPNDWMMLSSGVVHSCAADTDGMISCWGDDSAFSGRPSGYDGYWASVHTGASFTCGVEIKDEGIDYVKCWGDLASAGIDGFYLADNVSVGDNHLCYLDSVGDVLCAGDDTFGQSTAPVLVGVSVVATGPQTSCALTTDGALTCWGDVGVATTTTTKAKKGGVLTISGVDFVALAVGDTDVCGTTVTGVVACFDNHTGDIVDVPLSSNKGWAHITMGTTAHCVNDDAYGSTCWTESKELSYTSEHDVTALSAGTGFVCAIEDVWEVSKTTTTASSTKGQAAGGTSKTETEPDLVLLGNDLVCWGDSKSGAACPP